MIKMKTSKLVLYVVVLLYCNFCEAQTFYGSSNFGRFEILNDSTCTLCFISDNPLMNRVDSCSCVKTGDTIYISTKVRHRFEIVEEYPFETLERSSLVYKEYRYQFLGEGYQLLNEDCVCENDKIMNFPGFKNGDIIVVRYFIVYDRFKWIYGEERPIIKYNIVDGCCFDNFPLLMRGNQIIPIDEEKNEQCWIENGFYFPTMKRSRKEKSFDVIGRWSIGLRGLPNGYNIPENKFSKHRD